MQMYVLVLWEETGSTQRDPCKHRVIMQTPHRKELVGTDHLLLSLFTKTLYHPTNKHMMIVYDSEYEYIGLTHLQITVNHIT